jgi:hypothetical protein
MGQSVRPVRMSALARFARGLRPDRNPLRRATDRAEAAVLAGLAAAFLLGAPAAAVTAGHLAAAAGLRAEQTSRYKVQAMLLADAPGTFYTPYGPVAMPAVARWTAPDGSRRTGLVGADSVGHSGATVTIWVDKSGHLTGPPPRAGQVTTQAALAAAAAPVFLGLLVFVTGLVSIGALNTRRLAAWDAAWQEVGPRWSSRRS